ncbi:hypothetical protein CP97_10630 [Aurantiacibacter atlanticus]|uniref:Extensin-like C-terminal domain-containing protein n=1 Tax=Aurantiacibacter atlanticus TaxID=1648404 RepID=A0A0H4VCH9_9SPHN|nr:extensin family protein [Aurantiacibacter atlanticus]AKQ42382.1 hypothetical protein CP97_10630 [Aurantiacibacter atlanticus]MDF1834500.1 extensin family protein [Alteraurantiacibacter sp. bin_em_oilr2.035]
MTRTRKGWPIAPPSDAGLVILLIGIALLLAGRVWLVENPQHNPWAPLDLRDPVGLATVAKLAALQDDIPTCHAVLNRSEIGFTALDPAREGECLRSDRIIPTDLSLAPSTAQMTCPVAAGFALWLRHGVQPAAQENLGSPVQRIEQLGTYSCRRMYGAESGRWSEHATGNAIDISAFILADGQRISLLQHWNGDGPEARFLREVRDAACASFGAVLSPDYNAAHANHFHLDQGRSPGIGACR